MRGRCLRGIGLVTLVVGLLASSGFAQAPIESQDRRRHCQ